MNKYVIKYGLIIFISTINISCGNKEFVKLTNPLNKEDLYIVKYEWPPDGCRIGISKNKRLDSWEVYNDKFLIEGHSYLLYGFKNDTLIVYTCGTEVKMPKDNNFKTTVIIKELENVKFIELLKEYRYKEENLTFFPPSDKYLVKNINQHPPSR